MVLRGGERLALKATVCVLIRFFRSLSLLALSLLQTALQAAHDWHGSAQPVRFPHLPCILSSLLSSQREGSWVRGLALQIFSVRFSFKHFVHCPQQCLNVPDIVSMGVFPRWLLALLKCVNCILDPKMIIPSLQN